MRKQLVSGKKLLLFVDTGDNCRCPLAIGYLTKLLSQKGIDYIDLRHMGVMTPNDLLPTPEVVQLLKEEGVDIRYHRSRPVNDDLIRQADLVLGFTAIHVQTCLRRVPDSKPKTFLLKDYVGLGHTGDQIHDPMGSTMEIFKKYFSDIKLALQRLVEMEFITAPPEPTEVVIAPTIVKPRFAEENEDSSARVAGADKESAKAAKSKKPKKRTEEAPEAQAKPSRKASVAESKPEKAAKPAKAPARKVPAKPAAEPLKKAGTAKPAKKPAAKPVGRSVAKEKKPAKVKLSEKGKAKSAAASAKIKKTAPAKKASAKKSK